MKFQAFIYILLIALFATATFVSAMSEDVERHKGHHSALAGNENAIVFSINMDAGINGLVIIAGYGLMIAESVILLYLSAVPINGLLLFACSIFASFGRNSGFKVKSKADIEVGASKATNELLKFIHVFSMMSLCGHLARSIFGNRSIEGSSQGFIFFWASALIAYALMWRSNNVFKNAPPLITLATLFYIAYKNESCSKSSSWAECLYRI